MTDTKPEALRLADWCDLGVDPYDKAAADELRRLHEENETLKKCLFQMQNAAIELAKPEQTKYSDIVSDGGLDPRNKFDAQPEQEQEPVAWLVSDAQGRYATIRDPSLYKEEVYEPLYAAPPRKPWQGLTADDIDWILGLAYADDMELIKTIETKLKEKNNG